MIQLLQIDLGVLPFEIFIQHVGDGQELYWNRYSRRSGNSRSTLGVRYKTSLELRHETQITSDGKKVDDKVLLGRQKFHAEKDGA